MPFGVFAPAVPGGPRRFGRGGEVLGRLGRVMPGVGSWCALGGWLLAAARLGWIGTLMRCGGGAGAALPL